MSRTVVAGLICIALFTACSGATTASQETISGTVTVRYDSDDYSVIDMLQKGQSGFAVGAPCEGQIVSAGYKDLAPGADVTVKNESDEIIAVGEVTEGKWVERACVLSFKVEQVPAAKFYTIEVSQRGPQRYSREDLENIGFKLDLVLG